MARDNYSDIMTRVNTIDVVTTVGEDTITFNEPLEGLQVTVYRLDDNGRRENLPALIYRSRHENEPHDNPFVTMHGGIVDFWADVGPYEIEIEDLNPIPRILHSVIGWNASPAEKASVTPAMLPDGGTGTVPEGTLLLYGGVKLPDGYMWPLGQKLERQKHPKTFASISTTYNTGGETAAEFRLPNHKRGNTDFDSFGNPATPSPFIIRV